MKKFRFYIISVVMLSFVYGCADDVLTKYPLDMISDQTVWSDPILIEQYLTQCYEEVGPYFDQGYLFDNTTVVLHELVMLGISDEATSQWNRMRRSQDMSVTGSHEYLADEAGGGETGGFDMVGLSDGQVFQRVSGESSGGFCARQGTTDRRSPLFARLLLFQYGQTLWRSSVDIEGTVAG
jgi:hypothetical protein